jgi:FHS family L-fucose permease-like MFS transporter
MVVAWTYAVAVNFVPSYVSTVDKVGESTVGIEGPKSKDEEAVLGTPVESAAIDEKHQAVHVER